LKLLLFFRNARAFCTRAWLISAEFTANPVGSRSSSALLHSGHAGVAVDAGSSRNSNSWPQPPQRYS
jgi:hypothetical protein